MREPTWKNTEKKCLFFNYSGWEANKNYNRTDYYAFVDYSWGYNYSNVLYPKISLDGIADLETKTINPDSKLYFDSGSGFPRYKLSVSGNKRCIKTAKADVIVVSGETNYQRQNDIYVVIEDNKFIYVFEQSKYNMFGSIESLIAKIPYWPFDNPRLIYTGQLCGFDKKNLWLAKYAEKEYTLNWITDSNLDKIINNMSDDLTYETLISILDMLNSVDTSVVQLGVKTLQSFNIDKYKLSCRLLLCSRDNWWKITRNTVGTKQLMDSLKLTNYNIQSSIINCSRYMTHEGEVYDASDVAIAKQLSKRLIEEYFQSVANTYFFGNDNYIWAPDERRVTLS